MKKSFANPLFINNIVDKVQLKKIIIWAFRNYGIARAANMVDKLKDLGFYYATKAGISLSLEDLRIPPKKQNLLKQTIKSIEYTDSRYQRGEITAVERFQKVIDTWNNASEALKKEVIMYFKNTDPLNTIYMMAFSGARGNISQVRQLVGMRGLMADPQGQIIDLPIASNFREGLTVTDYFISSYGARKGLVDTALRTADSGYLTRRLVDVAQDVIIREVDCKTSKGILLEDMIDHNKILINLDQALLGRVLAEEIRDPISNIVLARAGQAIDPWLANTIVKIGYKNVLVRSPITCDSVGSVCQLCYGWNLAHGEMVDLGEAVGIIAAQSIGEPGTQLTMRTFHTGGVFTGELAQKIINPIDGQVKYLNNMHMVNSRTRHGDSAMLITADCKIKIIDLSGKKHFINLVKGALLLVKDSQKISRGHVIAEYSLSNRIIKEKAQKAITADFSGSIYLKDFNSQDVSIDRTISNTISGSGVLWILSGIVYSIPDDAQLIIEQNQQIYENSLLAKIQLVSRHSGIVQILENQSPYKEVQIITSVKICTNIKVYLDKQNSYSGYILSVNDTDKFTLKIDIKQKVVHDQVIGDLITDIYKTKTGGIIKYLDLPISKKKFHSNHEYYDILGSGYILWIPEETHEVNKDVSLLLVNNGDFINVGTEIIKNVFANNAGTLEVIQRDGIIREIIIKPCKVYSIKNKKVHIPLYLNKRRGFLRPGEQVINDIVVDKLVYWEYMENQDEDFILIRPVIVYSVPKKVLTISYTKDSFSLNMFNLEIIRRTYYRDGARVKSIYGIDLLKTHLVVKLNPLVANLVSKIDLVPYSKSLFSLKLSTSDILSFKEFSVENNRNFHTKTLIKVKNGQYIKDNSIIAQTDVLSNISGTVQNIQRNKYFNRRILITTSVDIKYIPFDNNQVLKVKVNDWVYAGDEIASNLVTYNSGKIIAIRDNQIILRIGQPYLISKGSILHVADNSLIQRGENIATLMFERAKTGDIIQGLPRIEEILEARKKSDNSFNPHIILESNFRSYLNQGLSVYDSTRLSLLNTQLSLIKEVQLVYQSQGVEISDKHIEVIVRQMTSKVKIEKGGDTEYLPGEIIELQKVESVNHSLSVMNKKEASYCPILLGITKASLNTESFISAASFQETTKVLTEAAISGKLDWLRGLKENVIIGRLIPAGTGFNSYSSILNKSDDKSSISDALSTKSDKSISSFEDIIVDDRSIRNYHFNTSREASDSKNNN
uniref:RNA polymerase beta'' subunit n=1 Tax=Hypnea cervicornis TaxID=387623 RepID=UPI0021B66222|nr:RNA polymerase beta'' subunit [Hypnea cervicornis]UVW80738.1 RNA polymerase beta'' subunit [Hypnea cervicornis]